jgi:hypothetical protein
MSQHVMEIKRLDGVDDADGKSYYDDEKRTYGFCLRGLIFEAFIPVHLLACLLSYCEYAF